MPIEKEKRERRVLLIITPTVNTYSQLEPDVNLFEYGLVVASDALAQFLFSPLLGATIDRLRSVRLVCLLCSALFCGGNVFYALLGAFPQGEVKIRVWMMLVARCLTCLV